MKNTSNNIIWSGLYIHKPDHFLFIKVEFF